MYNVRPYHKSKLTRAKDSNVEGEPIEYKIERIMSNKEPITDGAPSIFTERSEGVLSAYNIRTDRWEIATDAMDKVAGSIQASRDNKAKNKAVKSKDVDKKEGKVVELKMDSDGGAKSIEGKAKAN